MQPQKFFAERSTVAFLIWLLTGWALLWARAIWNSQSTLINSFDAFTALFREAFGQTTGSLCVADQLIRLRQGSASMDYYTLHFRTLAASNEWNEAALLAAYHLNSQIPAMMAIYDDTIGLENFTQKAVKISQSLTTCQLDEIAPSPAPPVACPPVPEPMQVDSYHLSHTERAWRLTSGLCLYCGASRHVIRTCPSYPPRPLVSTLQVEPDISSLPLLTVQLLTSRHSVLVSALLDSGFSGNFISHALLKHLTLPQRRQAQELGCRRIKYVSCPCKWDVSIMRWFPFWYWRDSPWT